MYAFTITPQGPFSLAAGLGFLKGFTPARYHDTAQDQALCLAFPTDDGHSTVGVEVRQADGPQGTVEAEAIVHTGLPREGRAGTATESKPVPPSPRWMRCAGWGCRRGPVRPSLRGACKVAAQDLGAAGVACAGGSRGRAGCRWRIRR